MAAKKAKPSVAQIDNRSKLIDALSFLAIADIGKDIDKFSYVNFSNGYATAGNDCFTMGTPVDTGLDMCLHGEKLKAALQHCGENFVFAQIDGSSASVKSDKFRAIIPIVDHDILPDYGQPNPSCGQIGDSIKDCFSLLNPIITEKTDHVIQNGLHLKPFSGVATNGGVLIEYYHGFDLPPGLVIPKLTVGIIAKIKQKLTNFGFSKTSFTFYFIDGSYLRTKLIDGKYPDTDRIFPADVNRQPVPSEFYTALDAIDKFVDNDSVYFGQGHMSTHPSLSFGANYKVAGLPDGHCFSAVHFKRLRDIMGQIIWSDDVTKPMCFFGNNLRGLLVGKHG
jgi:hypothetical protein